MSAPHTTAWFPPSLLLLLRLQLRGAIRRLTRRAKTLRGMLLTVAGLVLVAAYFGPFLFLQWSQQAGPRASYETVRAIGAPALLLWCLASLLSPMSDYYPAFRPAEVNLLFPGPFTRRQLMGYWIVKAAAGSVIGGLWFALFLGRHSALWPAAALGMALAFFFTHMLTLNVALARAVRAQAVSARGGVSGRRIATLIVLASVLTGVLLSSGRGAELLGALAPLAGSPAAAVVLAPFEVFVRVFMAPRVFPELCLWTLAAAVLNAGLVLLALRLDEHFVEKAVFASQRVYARIEQAQRRGHVAAARGGQAAGRVPALPRWGGYGPTLWRQAVTMWRTSRATIAILAVLLAAAAALAAAGRASFADPDDAAMYWVLAVGAAAYLSLFILSASRTDFRGDLDHMETLKTLPIAPFVFVLGQVTAPALMLTLVHLTGILAAIYLGGPAYPLLLAAAAAPIANILLVAAVNLVFLLFPWRYTGRAGFDFGIIGQHLLLLLLRVVLVGGAGLLAVALGAAAYLMAGESWLAAWCALTAVLTAEAATAVYAAAAAFKRYDPSRDTPV